MLSQGAAVGALIGERQPLHGLRRLLCLSLSRDYSDTMLGWRRTFVLLFCLLGSLSACSFAELPVRPEERSGSLEPDSPDISGLGFVGGENLLAVHDAKGGSDRARVSRVRLPDAEAAFRTDPVSVQAGERQWPGIDLESIAPVPGTALVLLVESGDDKGYREPVPRIFLAEYRGGQLSILDATDWPVPVDNVEGTAVASAAGNLIFLYAERAEGRQSTQLRWATLTLQPLAFGPFRETTFSVRAAKGASLRPVSAIDVDPEGIIYAASAVDPGNDGPFRSIVWRIGRVHADEHGQPLLSLESRPRRLATLDGLKVEGLAVRRIAGKTQIIIGSDDESYGGVIRPLPH
jgi:hypothetical protein